MTEKDEKIQKAIKQVVDILNEMDSGSDAISVIDNIIGNVLLKTAVHDNEDIEGAFLAYTHHLLTNVLKGFKIMEKNPNCTFVHIDDKEGEGE